MSGDDRIGIVADVHGEHRLLDRVLNRCRALDVDRIVLLGDLFDRVDQAETCAALLAEWDVAGVLGNHEIDALHHRRAQALSLGPRTSAVLESLRTELVIGEARFIHEPPSTHRPDPLDQVLGRFNAIAIHHAARITFSGHTHHRTARDDRGPLDVANGRLSLYSDRRYFINPGAAADGLFAVWDRPREMVYFEHVW
jgi:predicted phosphodiesterase